MVAPARMAEIVEQAAAVGVKAIVGQSGGFAEEGETGRLLEDKMASVVDAHGIRFVGPNTAGFSDTATLLNTYFHGLPDRGGLAIVFQGGGVGSFMCEVARERGFGVSKIMSLGNQLRTNLIDCVEWLMTDDETSAVAVQVEGAPRSRSGLFMRDLVVSLSELSKKKGVAVFHTGRGATSAGLTYSHTSSMATPREVFEGACRQYGVCLAGTASDAVVIASIMQYRELRGGRRIAIIGSGSQSMYMADLCDEAGLAMPTFDEALGREITETLRHQVPMRNPLDLGLLNLPVLGRVLGILRDSDQFDALLYSVPSEAQMGVIPLEDVEPLWTELTTFSAKSEKPIVGIEWFGSTSSALRKRFEQEGQTLTGTPEEAVRILKALSLKEV
jgi:acyl-CoA synthetase (NDP forming)